MDGMMEVVFLFFIIYSAKKQCGNAWVVRYARREVFVGETPIREKYVFWCLVFSVG